MFGLAGMATGGIYGFSKQNSLFCAVRGAPGIGGLSSSDHCPEPYTVGDGLLATAAALATSVS